MIALSPPHPLRLAARAALELACAFALLAVSARADEVVVACGPVADNVFHPSSAYGMTASPGCPDNGSQGHGLLLQAVKDYRAGQGAIFQASAPAGLTIVQASIPPGQLYTYGVDTGQQYGGDFYWTGGSTAVVHGATSFASPPMASRDFGFLLVCAKATCQSTGAVGEIDPEEVVLSVRETTAPSLSSPTGIWPVQGWVRGAWSLSFSGNSPSGLCGLSADFADRPLPGSGSGRDPSQWHQCAAGPVADSVITQGAPDGPNPLRIGAYDAAGETVNYTKTVYVDNQRPTVSLSGPSDASSASGTQFVRATAAAGPSGVAAISCVVDAGPGREYPGATAEIPVSGIGEHTVRCASQNNAVDSSGQRAASAPATFSMKVGQPTVLAVGFSNVVDGLRCRRATERVTVPAHWVRVRRNGHLVREHRAAHLRTVRVRRCHVRTERRRVTIWVTERRNGHRVRVKEHRFVRVVLHPRTVSSVRKFVPHGHAATIRGWLGTTSGVALGGRRVDVLSAPDDGRSSYSLAAVVATAANGSWSTKLPPGPSRLVTAAYTGGPTTEGSLAAPVQLVVPAKLDLLSIEPSSVPWGGTVRLTGKLDGGYLPPGGALVRLRIGLGKVFITYGVHEHVGGSGRFTTTYTFGAGDAAVHRSYWFQIASLPMGDYPFAPANSRRIAVLVGGHPRSAGRAAPRRS